MWAVAIFLAVVASAAGYAVWNDRKSTWWDAPPKRDEPHFTTLSL